MTANITARQRRLVSPTDGFTLLEVILAIAVLAVALAVVGEANRTAHINAEKAALESDAILIAESVMAGFVAGVTPLADTAKTPWEEIDNEPAWQYSVKLEPTNYDSLIQVTVQVTELQTGGDRPIGFTLTRWLLDPTATEGSPGAAGEPAS